ncbi:PEP-CTERM sorting domain-containing protein (plasmid) [Cyanobacterium sp. IPPAS B-1200]|uniref:PEP-CTERM sorting domain-containing protein n=1 Tax=Cyanobacterium sp. IPPAS B-1200 TaxID=1562720 RepID=UPI0008528B1D|nr:PEP-CTERM sorting domain-containing protein [Cyanobacterium sp. IPPAS B-1200]OEJ78386.1 hypothetical protein A5482_13565 [Cyanobacterium sp. IPPAS B-1200]
MATVNSLAKLSMATVGTAVIALSVAGTAQAVVLTFDDVTQGSSAEIPNGYGGLNWSNFWVLKGTSQPGNGYEKGIVSGDYVAFNSFANPAEITGSLFDFNGAFLTAAWNDGLSVLVEGFNSGTNLYSQTVVVNTTSPTWFDFNFLGVDRLRFSSFGGVQNPNLSVSDTHFAMDNFTFNETQAVPEPTSLIGILGLGAFGVISLRKRKRG